jgi:hypothetical protein
MGTGTGTAKQIKTSTHVLNKIDCHHYSQTKNQKPKTKNQNQKTKNKKQKTKKQNQSNN